MKKLLSLAMVLATGALFAQNVNTSYQNGLGNDVTVTQVGINNNSNANQDGKIYGAGNGGDFNMATVNQLGVNNISDISQQGNRNTGTVDQAGWFNSATQIVGTGFAEDNFASSDQTGGLNESIQRQRFDNNSAMITQIGDGFLTYGGNFARQNQSSGADGVNGSDAVIYQEGQDNRAIQRQRGSDNYAEAYQMGDDNRSRENQTSLSGGANANMSYVTQIGSDNRANVTQDALFGDNFSSVMQLDDNHRATVNQNTFLGANNSYIYQDSLGIFSGNTATVTQSTGFTGNNSNVVQFGTNTATISQTSW